MDRICQITRNGFPFKHSHISAKWEFLQRLCVGDDRKSLDTHKRRKRAVHRFDMQTKKLRRLRMMFLEHHKRADEALSFADNDCVFNPLNLYHLLFDVKRGNKVSS